MLHLRPIERSYSSLNVTLPSEWVRKRPVSEAFSCFDVSRSPVPRALYGRFMPVLRDNPHQPLARRFSTFQRATSSLSNRVIIAIYYFNLSSAYSKEGVQLGLHLGVQVFCKFQNEKYTLGVHLGVHFYDIHTLFRRGLMT